MAWVAPRTWTAGEVVTAAMLNQDIRDNMNAVAGGRALVNTSYLPSGDITTTSTTFTVADGTNLKQTATINFGRWIGWWEFTGHCSGTAGNPVYFTTLLDDTTYDSGIANNGVSQAQAVLVDANSSARAITLMFAFGNLSAASHYVKLVQRTTNAATTSIVKGASSAHRVRMISFEI